jgi:hypothetical protein
MAELFYEIGILLTKDYMECSASDLIGEYVGQTGPKTRDVLKRALGKVLFVDEAFRLCDGQFGNEAANELVDSLTKPQFIGKIVIILAGYSDDMNNLLKVNPGLSSRFPEEIVFENMKPRECLTLLERQIRDNGIQIVPEFQGTSSEQYLKVIDQFKELSSLPSWGNGRDIKTLSKSITNAVLGSTDSTSSSLTVTILDISKALASMLERQRDRCTDGTRINYVNRSAADETQSRSLTASPPPPVDATMLTNSSVKTAEPKTVIEEKEVEEVQCTQAGSTPQRDPDVSDETWEQLQADIAAEEAGHKLFQESAADQRQHIQDTKVSEEASSEAMRNLEKSTAQAGDNEEEISIVKRKLEEERVRNLTIKIGRQEAEERLRRIQEKEEKRKQEEAQVQRKLEDMGVCPMGYRWRKQVSGYRCEGGSHFVSHSQLGI